MPRGRKRSVPYDFRGQPIVMRGRAPSIHVPIDGYGRPLANVQGYVVIYRLIASEMLGRWLTRKEAVELIDGDPWNWAPSNLRVVPLGAHLQRWRTPRVGAP